MTSNILFWRLTLYVSNYELKLVFSGIFRQHLMKILLRRTEYEVDMDMWIQYCAWVCACNDNDNDNE